MGNSNELRQHRSSWIRHQYFLGSNADNPHGPNIGLIEVDGKIIINQILIKTCIKCNQIISYNKTRVKLSEEC